jgi:His/Glu/Gln/Arg/opine family amino acid ABC transporter permease subunit
MNSFLSLIPRFAEAILVTLEVSLLAAFIGALGGFVLNALRLRFPRWLAGSYRVYVWLVRGTPYLSQLVIVYFGLPVIGITMTAVQATIVSLAFYSAAYFAEIFRAGWATWKRRAPLASAGGPLFAASKCPRRSRLPFRCSRTRPFLSLRKAQWRRSSPCLN